MSKACKRLSGDPYGVFDSLFRVRYAQIIVHDAPGIVLEGAI